MTFETPTGTLSFDDIRAYMLEAADAPIINIGQKGMALQTVEPLTIGNNYYFRIKCGQMSVTLLGQVVRCHLNELAVVSTGGQQPLYHNGVSFNIERNPIEIALLDILQENRRGEKRTDFRIAPVKDMLADVARSSFMVKEFDESGVLLESTHLPDLDEDWPLMILVGPESFRVDCRVIYASKKSDSPNFATRLEYPELDEALARFIRSVARKLPSE